MGPVTIMNQIIIENYNQEWAEFFIEEAGRIVSVASECLVDIYHIGSTSVPGLSAKPIIDIIFVTTDLFKARKILTSEKLGYRFKGEYNLPLHDLYDKQGKFKIYLHIHLYGSPEIKLNLMFRDYLRTHSEACEEYVQAKVHASQMKDAAEKMDTGVTHYNLMKNEVITSILKKTGFSELCVRFVTQENERKAFKHHRCFNVPGLPEIQKSKKMVLYNGVDIIEAAEFCYFEDGSSEIIFITRETKEGFSKLIKSIEDWLKIRTSVKLLLVRVSNLNCEQDEQPIYESLGYSRDPSLRGVVMCKKLRV